jgi:4-diphosphocytidyl-2-C-methyl-D-erythritol kinase
LRDKLELSLTKKDEISLEVKNSEIPAGPENLVWRAIDAMRSELKLKDGIHARLEKRIPVARGLGGGSSDAAAALIGMMRLTKKFIPLERLMEIAASLGADVPFFLFGGRALAVNRGDEVYPLPNARKRTIVVVSPKGIGVSTKDAYAWLSAELTKRPEPPKIWGFCALCWSRQEAVSNDFEGPVFGRHPRLGEIRDGLLKRGAADAALAGSGSAVFGIFRNPARARRAARAFPEDSVFVVETVSRENYGRALGWRVTA